MKNPYQSPEVPKEYRSLSKCLRDVCLTVFIWFITLALFPVFYIYTVIVERKLRMALWPILDLLHLFVIIVVWVMAWYGTYQFVVEFIK